MRPVIIKVFLLCFVMAAPVLAQADASTANTERAREAFGAAQKLYQASRFAEALKKFEEAQVLKPHPVIIFNIARCHELLGAFPQALHSYREYLRLSPDAADRAAVLASISSLEKRVPPQQLVVNAEPEGSAVFVDGKRAGTAPVSVSVAAGEHTLEVSAEGYESLKRSVTVAAQRTVELNVVLRAQAAATSAVVTDAPKKDPELTPVESPSTPMVTEPVAPGRKRPFTWIAGGTALAAGAVAVGLGMAANGTAAELHSGDGSRSGARSGELATQAQGLATGASFAWGLAGAAAITAVVLFIVEGAPPAP